MACETCSVVKSVEIVCQLLQIAMQYKCDRNNVQWQELGKWCHVGQDTGHFTTAAHAAGIRRTRTSCAHIHRSPLPTLPLSNAHNHLGAAAAAATTAISQGKLCPCYGRVAPCHQRVGLVYATVWRDSLQSSATLLIWQLSKAPLALSARRQLPALAGPGR
jgi:hypothetical protein